MFDFSCLLICWRCVSLKLNKLTAWQNLPWKGQWQRVLAISTILNHHLGRGAFFRDWSRFVNAMTTTVMAIARSLCGRHAGCRSCLTTTLPILVIHDHMVVFPNLP